MQTTQSRAPGGWHPGEEAMHRRLDVPHEENPTVPGLPMAWAAWTTRSPLIALGTVDAHDRVWTTVLGGRPGIVGPTASGIVRVTSSAHLERRTDDDVAVWTGSDPVLETLFSGDESAVPDQPDVGRSWIIDHPDGGKLVAGLAIDLEQRMRVKLAGRMVGGVIRVPQDETATGRRDRVEVITAIGVDESLGNCPKYLNRKTVWPHEAAPHLVGDTVPLAPDAVDLINRSDLVFMSSRYGADSMDTNHRGGPPGFVRVLDNSADAGVTLVYPEYSGNRLYQSLGNLVSDPAVGITFPDVETGDVLYLSGRAEVLIGADAAELLPHSRMAVRIHVDAVRFVRDGLPFRGRPLDPSPYNPPVRRLACELGGSGVPPPAVDADGRAVGSGTATLIGAVPITPTISRYTFRLSADPSSGTELAGLAPWRAGQHIVLDFSAQLDRGWSHMRDHDPRSLNDDHIRSFTISSEPPAHPRSGDTDGIEFDLTVRRQGPATNLLARWRPGSPLEIAVLGFGGGDDIGIADATQGSDDQDIVVVAGGVGITPLLPRARTLLDSGGRLHVLWSVRADDLPLALDVIGRFDGMAAVTTLFVTGPIDTAQEARCQDLVRTGVRVHTRRIAGADVRGRGTPGRRHLSVSAGRALKQSVLEWVDGEPVSFENFDY